jgi:Zn-dependent peptidase ImmA (M78 family)
LRTSTHIEAEANRFAAAVLMPEKLVRDQAAAVRVNVPLLADRFGVSAPAMKIRLDVLDLLPEYMK